MNRRRLASTAIATLATVGLLVACGTPVSEVGSTSGGVSTAPPPGSAPGTVPVDDQRVLPALAATGPIRKGMTVAAARAESLIGTMQVPQRFRPATAMTDHELPTELVALFDIAPGTILVKGMFVDAVPDGPTPGSSVPVVVEGMFR